jgi:glycosyltransferase involved in cell wall biosynthesis
MQQLDSTLPIARASPIVDRLGRVTPHPVRVAHLYSSLGVYGAERWTLALIEHLDPGIVHSLILTIGTKPGATDFHDLVMRRGLFAEHLAIPGKLNAAAIKALRDVLKRERIDILHAHGFKSDILGFLACARSGIPIISTVHGWSGREGLRIRLYEALGRIALRGFDRIYPVSPALYDDLIAHGLSSERVKLIVNAVDIRQFDACFAQRVAREPRATFNVLFAGRLCKPKGVHELIKAFALVGNTMRLRFAGVGPEREQLEITSARHGLADRVEFVGAVDGMDKHFGWADVLVLPSYAEGIPRIVMECFAAGVPVIASDIPGIRTLIDAGSTGLLVPVRDTLALASALCVLASDRALGPRLALAARQLIESQFSAERLAAQYTEEYQWLAGSARQMT